MNPAIAAPALLLSLSLLASFTSAQCVPSWSGAPTLNNMANSSLVLANGQLVIGGAFSTVNGVTARGLAIRNGTTFSELAGGVGAAVQPSVRAMAQLPGGDLLVGGTFGTAGGLPIRHVARLNLATNTFSQLGAGLSPGSASVEAIHVLPNGQAVIGGQFFGVSGGSNVLLYDANANTLLPLGGPTAGPGGIVHALTSVSGGGQTRLFVGGNFNGTFTPTGTLSTWNIARFDFPAGVWRRVGPGTHPNGDGVNGPVFGLHNLNNTILVGGSFSAAFGQALGPGLSVMNVAQVVSGPITSTWGQLGAGLSHSGLGVQASVSSFLSHPFLGLVAGGQFDNSGGNTTNMIARFDGANWQPIDTGLSGGAIAVVETLTTLPGGGLLCGGAFTAAAGVPATNIATRVVCPALAPSYSAGCASSAGVLTLTPNNRPIVGSTFFASCTNVPNSAIAISAFGFLPASVPIASVGLPSGPACLLLTSGDSTTLLLPTFNSVQTSLPIPASPGLLGLNLFHQVVTLDLDANGNIVDAAGSNGLAITVGEI